ncbi:MAG TPA: hypothetical protein VK550_13190, partial [Polyangiaceae bacterium]|nr:hypothetical protein [Polyangiaceae bacterium]
MKRTRAEVIMNAKSQTKHWIGIGLACGLVLVEIGCTGNSGGTIGSGGSSSGTGGSGTAGAVGTTAT